MTELLLLNWNKDKIELKSRKIRNRDLYRIEAKIKENKEYNRKLIQEGKEIVLKELDEQINACIKLRKPLSTRTNDKIWYAQKVLEQIKQKVA